MDSRRSPNSPPIATAMSRPIEIVPNNVRTTNAPMMAPAIPPTVLFGLNGDSGKRAQRKWRNPFPPHQAATLVAATAKHTRYASVNNTTRCARDQQIHTEPNAVNAVRLEPFSTSPPSTDGSAQNNMTIGTRAKRDGRSHAASGYSTAIASSNQVSTLLRLTN